MPLVRLTLQPGEIKRVAEQELTDLERMGLIYETVSYTDELPAPLETPNARVRIVGTSADTETPAEKRKPLTEG